MDDLVYYDDIFDMEIQQLYVQRRHRDRMDPFAEYSEIEFKNRYRFQKETVTALIALLQDDLQVPGSRRGLPLTAEQQVLLFLRFMATGCFQRELGDLHGYHQTTTGTVVHRVAEKIARLKPRFLHFPSMAEAQAVHDGFYNIAPFPGIIGLIDCTHVPVSNPGGEVGELFRNRKGWFSINVQVVSNHKSEITNIVARWPGSTHDARIFNASNICEHLERNPGLGHLLGDQGYPCLPTLLTPLGNPATRPERRYNGAHKSVRNKIECLFGIWKRRFPVLSKGLRFKPEKCCTVIIAAAVLHNLAVLHGDPNFEEDVNDTDAEDDQFAGAGDYADMRGAAKRAHIIANNC